MAQERDDELRGLRARAYGPDADIHLDVAALGRLRELETVGRQQEPTATEEAPRPPAEPLNDDNAVEVAARPPARDSIAALSRVPRSSLVIVLGVAIVAMIIAVSPALLERVQTDPLQEGAVQVARLSIDPGYRAPAIFSSNAVGADPDNTAEGFQVFHGLRAVRADDASSVSEPRGSCLIVYVDENIVNADSTSFSGPSFYGCSVGGFPATTQFRVAAQGLPGELVTAFPASPALQFVFDSTHNEVVVFADSGDGR